MYKNFYGSIAFFRRLGFGRRLHGLLLLRGLSYVQKCEVAGASAHALVVLILLPQCSARGSEQCSTGCAAIRCRFALPPLVPPRCRSYSEPNHVETACLQAQQARPQHSAPIAEELAYRDTLVLRVRVDV